MRRIKISNPINKTGDTGDDYLINLYDNYDAKPVVLNGDTVYKIKIGNDIGYLKTLQGTIGEDNSSLILSAKDLAEFPDGTYYIEVWFEKDGLNYIFPSSGKARIKLDANIETIKGKMIPTLTVEELRQEIAEKAVAGPKGDTGLTGPQGEKGANGAPGKDGKSAYQVWLDNGNHGNETDFINSLKGPKGDIGPVGLRGPQGEQGLTGTAGKDGKNGSDGKSAYQIWLDAGNTGTEQDFLKSLMGKDGKQGEQGPQGEKGPQGLPGKNGIDGVQGVAGKDGLSAYQIWIGLGNTGSEADFLKSLKGKDGKASDIDLENLQFYIPSGNVELYVQGENGFDEDNESIEAETARVQKQGDKYTLLTSNGTNLLQVLFHKTLEHDGNLSLVIDTLTALLSNDYEQNPLLKQMQTINYNTMIENQAALQQYSESTNKQIEDLKKQIDELKK